MTQSNELDEVQWQDEEPSTERQWYEEKRKDPLGDFAVLQNRRGKRYMHCKFGNYIAREPEQIAAVEQLINYGKNASQEIEAGKNIILFGSKGTGKDHLLMALSRGVVHTIGATVFWHSGAALFDKWRTEAAGKVYRDRQLLFCNCDERTADVLWLSDPTSPSGGLSDYIESKLFELIDCRYSEMKPTWITCNVADSAELAMRIGSAAADRLRECCLPIYCDWASHRTNE